jgi:hypothetical protein
MMKRVSLREGAGSEIVMETRSAKLTWFNLTCFDSI